VSPSLVVLDFCSNSGVSAQKVPAVRFHDMSQRTNFFESQAQLQVGEVNEGVMKKTSPSKRNAVPTYLTRQEQDVKGIEELLNNTHFYHYCGNTLGSLSLCF
jgi:hypothetical protein